jgi:S1-C subfamily serine protease
MSRYYYENNQILPQKWASPPPKASYTWLIVLILLLVLGAVGYHYYWIPRQAEEMAKAATVFIQTEHGEASGVVVDPKGMILTNRHVVEGSTHFNVTINSGTPSFRKLEARLFKKSPGKFTVFEGAAPNASPTPGTESPEATEARTRELTTHVPSDWAVLVITSPLVTPLVSVPVDLAEPPGEGEPVVVLGFPAGHTTSVNDYGGPQVYFARGSVASIKKDNQGHPVAIVHTAPTAPGSSGGPVIYNGHLIGITALGGEGGQNWAVPVCILKGLVFNAQGAVVK